MRRNDVEKDLQNALDNGHNVWAIGDVHGFSVTLEVQQIDRVEPWDSESIELASKM